MSYVQVCPQCGSKEIQQVSDNPLFGAMGAPAKYQCMDCSFRAAIFPEIDEDNIKEFAEETGKEIGVTQDKGEQVDTTYGRFLLQVIWRIISIPITVFGLIGVFNGELSAWSYLVIGLIIGYFSWIRKHKNTA
jgi:DNA-directed RNA polymerase subunit RPC12/RpoP